MIEIRFTKKFLQELKQKFGKRKAIDYIEKFNIDLKKNPDNGKNIAHIGKILIKEIKINSFRFYFICEGFSLKLLLKGELIDLILIFVRLSKKNNQQKTIDEIKETLKKLSD